MSTKAEETIAILVAFLVHMSAVQDARTSMVISDIAMLALMDKTAYTSAGSLMKIYKYSRSSPCL
jgi:hypothetical protein